jgi:transcriptional regulator with XRE-family HTH domain
MSRKPKPPPQLPRANQTDKDIGSRIRAQRLIKGLSQERLGDAIGLTFQQVQKYEKGSNRVSGSRLRQIADALGVEPAFFFQNGKGPASDTDESVADLLALVDRRDAVRILRGLNKLSGKNRGIVADLVEAWAEK